jgi:hypothetical protein
MVRRERLGKGAEEMPEEMPEERKEGRMVLEEWKVP